MSRVRTGYWGWLAASALAAACVAPTWAQYVGRVDDSKQQAGTHLRATAILEYTGELGKIKESRLVPIAVWDGTNYQPGGLYLAQPAPLAVLSGTQYELESTGRPDGFFNVSDAEDLAGLWVGVGKYLAPPPPRPKVPASRRNHTYVVRDVDPDKPHFAHMPADDQSQNASAAGAPPSGGSQPSAPPVDPDRPTLHSRTGSGDSGSDNNAGAGSSGSPSSSSQADTDPDRPTFHRRNEASAAAPTNRPPIDPDRPRLEYTAPEEQEKIDQPDALFGIPANMNQIAGVSDNRTTDTESWTFSWANPEDENKMKAALAEIAEKAIAPPAPAAPAAPAKAAHRRTRQPAPPPLPMLTDEQFRAFSLSFGGGATMVFSARSAGAPAKYVTLIAAPDFYGNPKVLLQQVTSDADLDVSPRYQLVDAVDTQGSGRADLLFELRGRTWRQFAIYRIAEGTATEAFVTQPTPANWIAAAAASASATHP
ncbi:MAG TPA: hypothetical protein VL990_05380 [Acidobacteriaceae bacterium]|nr:hypothetical protein [Acidobacteriaceae bacterium]